ncbi:hypothetical protein QBC45DRAFT_406602, partial [Copromyces sp. CBS 386.78]
MVEYLCIETVFRRVPGLGRPAPPGEAVGQSLEPLSQVARQQQQALTSKPHRLSHWRLVGLRPRKADL